MPHRLHILHFNGKGGDMPTQEPIVHFAKLYDQLYASTLRFGNETVWTLFIGNKRLTVEAYSENFGKGGLYFANPRYAASDFPRRDDFRRVVQTCAAALANEENVDETEFVAYVIRRMELQT